MRMENAIDRMRAVQRRIERRDTAQRLLDEARESERVTRTELGVLLAGIDRERQDVAQVTGFGLKGWLARLLGKRDAKLKEEKADVRAASREIDEAKGKIDDAVETAEQLERELAGFGDLEAELEALLTERESAIYAAVDIRIMHQELQSARTWGHLDRVGLSVIGAIAKHGRLDAAKAAAEQSKSTLR